MQVLVFSVFFKCNNCVDFELGSFGQTELDPFTQRLQSMFFFDSRSVDKANFLVQNSGAESIDVDLVMSWTNFIRWLNDKTKIVLLFDAVQVVQSAVDETSLSSSGLANKQDDLKMRILRVLK